MIVMITLCVSGFSSEDTVQLGCQLWDVYLDDPCRDASTIRATMDLQTFEYPLLLLVKPQMPRIHWKLAHVRLAFTLLALLPTQQITLKLLLNLGQHLTNTSCVQATATCTPSVE